MNKKQAAFMGIFDETKTFVRKHYSDRFKRSFATISDTIRFDMVTSELIQLSIVPRGTKAPFVKLGGFSKESITPDMIKGTAAYTPEEILELRAGQMDVAIGGAVVNNKQYIIDKKIMMLKTGYENTVEAMCAELFLTGKFKLAESGDEIDFGFPEPEEITFTQGTDNWELILIDAIDKYVEKNRKYPELIEVDREILKAMIKDKNLNQQQIAFGFTQIVPNTHSLEQRYPTLNILDMTVKALVPAVGVDGEAISTTNMMYLSNTESFVKAYTGIPNVQGNELGMEKSEYIIDEVIEHDPPAKKFIFTSGFCPIIPLVNSIMRFKITIKPAAKE